MKKDSSKKTVKKSVATTRDADKPIKLTRVTGVDVRPCKNTWSVSLYVYWFIILFFIAATFYILGRSHGALTSRGAVNNVEITEEALMQSGDYYEKGKTELLAGNYESALQYLTDAINANEDNVDAYILRGETYLQTGDYDLAMADFDKTLSMDENNSIAYYDRALLNTRLENYNAALNDINNALAARVESPNEILQLRDLYAKRGQLNLWLKNWQGAIADYTNSLARPDGIVSPSVYAERAEAYTAIGDYQNAIADYASAVRVISEQIQGVSSAAERESLSSQAMSCFEKSAALNLNMGNVDAATTDLGSARTIAVALNDEDSVDRITGLLEEIAH